MKLRAEINDENHDVEIRRDGDRVFAEIDGRRYELEVSEPEPNVYLLKNDNKIYEAFVTNTPNPAEPAQVRIGTDEFEVRLIDPKRLRGTGSDHEHGDGFAEIKTAMPGKVVRIIASVGTTVQKGDGVIVVEAMKMQNELKSPKVGTIKEIRVEEGETVAAGDILAVVE